MEFLILKAKKGLLTRLKKCYKLVLTHIQPYRVQVFSTDNFRTNGNSFSEYDGGKTVMDLRKHFICGGLFAAALLVTGAAQAVTFDLNFDGYADTAAMKADFAQTLQTGGHYIEQDAYDIAIDNAVAGADGKTCQLTVTPANDGPQAQDRTGVWLYTGTGNVFPDATFQNGTDFSFYFDIRVDANAIVSFKEKVCSPAFCAPDNYTSNFNQNHSFVSAQSDYSGSNPGEWGLQIACYEGEDGAGAGADEDEVGVPLAAVFASDTWYRCRVLVDWPTDGVTTNTTVDMTFKVWNRSTSDEFNATVYTFPTLSTSRLTMGNRSGDAWGIMAFIYDSSAATYNIWYDNIHFQDNLDAPVPPPDPLNVKSWRLLR